MTANDVLVHFGIPGMRWGRRKAKPGTTRKPRVVKKSTTVDDAPIKKRVRVSDISDDDLRKAIARIQMEKQYAQLTAKEKSMGRKIVEEVLVGAGKQVATQYAAKYMGQGVEALLKKK